MDADMEMLAQRVYGAICCTNGIKAKEIAGQLHFRFAPLPGTEAEIAVCPGDMLFNAFDEDLGFLGYR